MKLSPPQIESKLPAFINGTINIPFNLNRAVGYNEVSKLQILIKSVQTNTIKAILTTEAFQKLDGMKGCVAYFNNMNYIDSDGKAQTFNPIIGQYYKIQLACYDKEAEELGYYSSVGIIKCTAAPIISFNENNLTRNSYEYTVTCKQSNQVDTNGNPMGDITEKIYSYCFKLYDENNELVATSGEQIHNNSKDISSYEQVDTWTLRKALDANVSYKLEYSATTTNGYRIEPVYKVIRDGETVPPNVHANLVAQASNEDGYIKISLVGNGDQVRVSGSFLLIRSSSEDGFSSWYPMTKFGLTQWDATTTKNICKDYSIQQGITYQYAIQAYNNLGLYSNRMLSNKEICDFEDAFLYDGDKQLKIRFNPKVNNFKSTILESKTDTLGGKYPFIFRNGNVEYKEFQISGLISTLGDENNEFKFKLYEEDAESRTDAAGRTYRDLQTWLTGANYQRERQFKLEVLEWLTNGKPKLFRSPAEGNYIVRLMNVSLSPNDTLGRMLHTFTCSAVEIAAPTFDNFYDYGFVVEDYTETRDIKIEQIDLNSKDIHISSDGKIISLPGACLASISADPFTEISYTLTNYAQAKVVNIGETGNYYFPEEVLKETPLISIKLESERWGSNAHLTFGYYDTTTNNFSYISDIKITDEMSQICGEGVYYDNKGNVVGNNIISSLEDVRTKLGKFHYLKIETKILEDIYWNGTKYQVDNTFIINNWNQRTLYRVLGGSSVIFFDGNNPPPNLPPFVNGNINPQLKDYVLYSNDHLFDLKINDNPVIDFSGNSNTDGRYGALKDINSISFLCAGKGLVLDAVYQKKEITYAIEEEKDLLKKLKQEWSQAKNNYINNSNNSNKILMNSAYNSYISMLRKMLDEEAAKYDIEFAI